MNEWRKRATAAACLSIVLASADVMAATLADAQAAYRRADYASAAQIAREMADQGDASAQAMLGTMYERGQGVEKDAGQALEWYRKSADQGNAFAQTWLGEYYERSQGATGDMAQAALWYRKAADQGFSPAQFDLGRAYLKGDGVEQSNGSAAEWFRKAPEQGNGYAQYSLGALYLSGHGVPESRVEGFKWIYLSVQSMQGPQRTQAADTLERVRRAMSQVELDRARTAVREWHPTPPSR